MLISVTLMGKNYELCEIAYQLWKIVMGLSREKQSVKKITFTQKVTENEKQIIVAKGRNRRLSLAEGQFIHHECENIFTLHGGVSDELETSQVVYTSNASTIITLLLKGRIKFGYDDLAFDLCADEQPQALIVNLTQPCNFHRHLILGNHVVKLNIMINSRWLRARSAQSCPATQFLSQHKSAAALEFSPEMLAMTHRALKISTPKTLTEFVQLDACIFSLIEQCVKQLASSNVANPQQLATKHCDSVDRAIHYIEQNLKQDISIEQLARLMAMSISSLQNKFKQQLGTTVANYIKDRRLHIARSHLERGYCTVTEAAYDAGYNHPSNFSSAFKKAFGVSPQAFISQSDDGEEITPN